MVLVEVIETNEEETYCYLWKLSKENTASVEAEKFEVAAVWIRTIGNAETKQIMEKNDDYCWEREDENTKKAESLRSKARAEMREKAEEREGESERSYPATEEPG